MPLKAERSSGTAAVATERPAEAPAQVVGQVTRSSARSASRPFIAVRIRRADLLAVVLFAGCALLMFRLSLFEGWTFVGDSDRLNTALNIRLFETDAIRSRGSVPTWSDDQFMGYDVIAVHWLLPGLTPLPYLLALLPSSEMYVALSALATLLLALTLAATYWALGPYTTAPLPRIAGALLYGLGAYTVHKLTQLDLSFAALTMAPLTLRLVHEIRRTNAPWMFLALAMSWGALVVFTLLQEIAYIALLFCTYALYRSVRLRNPWPVVITGLAFVCGTAIGLPRVLTIAADFPLLARTSFNIQTEAIEALRYFGDGLLGRTPYEQSAVGGQFINIHEGVQLLHSSMAALAVFALGLLDRSATIRLWTLALMAVVSVTMAAWWFPFYESFARTLPLSRQLRTAILNGQVFGLPLWLALGWLAARRGPVRDTGRDGSVPGQTLASRVDGPFFFGFAALGLAAILIPEARSALYYGFMRIDFLHSRLSVAITLPLAALMTVFLSQYWRDRAMTRVSRWLAIGVLFGGAGWLAREVMTESVVGWFGPILESLAPRMLLTVETFRLVTSLVVLVVGLIPLLRRSRTSMLVLTGSALAAWISLETIAAADFKLNGPQTTMQAVPFQALNYMNSPPGELRVPSPTERAAVRDRLEADDYRVVFLQDNKQFAAHVEPHLTAFWGLRGVEGYSTGLPRRLAMLPWAGTLGTSHDLDFDTTDPLPWKLLAALNVKYAVVVSPSFWYNPAPGARTPPFDLQTLEIHENPYPVTPRAFFTAHVTAAGPSPRLPGDSGARPAPRDLPVEDPAAHSIVEGIAGDRDFATDGTPVATFDGDRVVVTVQPSGQDRFLVLNEMYHPAWRAWIDGRPAEIYPTNLVMRGILVPAGTATIELRYVPFLMTWGGIGLFAVAIGLTGLIWWALQRSAILTTMRRAHVLLSHGPRAKLRHTSRHQ